MPSDGDLELAADQAIPACGSDAREAVKALLVAIDFLEAQAADLRVAVSHRYSRGRYDGLSRKPGCAGAVACGDPATGEFSDAKLIRKFGDVPDDLSAL